MRWLVCGGRTYGELRDVERDTPLWEERYQQYYHVVKVLDQLSIERSTCYVPDDNWLPGDVEIIHGGARGADFCADQWAVVNWCPKIHEFKADWVKYGKAAGYIRNKRMLEEGKPNLVIAFPGGKGTAMMIKLAKEANVEVMTVPRLEE